MESVVWLFESLLKEIIYLVVFCFGTNEHYCYFGLAFKFYFICIESIGEFFSCRGECVLSV